MKDNIKKLREKTGAGIVACQNALKDASGDLEKAIDILRKQGLNIAAKKSSRTTNEGMIGSYIHAGSKIGVLVEVNCETDFVARNEDFKNFVKDVAMQVAASFPRYVRKEDVPQDVLAREKDILKAQIKDKPEPVLSKIVEGKLDKFYSENCLMEQPFIKDPNIKIKDLLVEVIAKIKENINVRRFIRYQVGEES